MKPVEDTEALKFFESVFNSEKKALVEKTDSLSKAYSEATTKHSHDEEVIRNLVIAYSGPT